MNKLKIYRVNYEQYQINWDLIRPLTEFSSYWHHLPTPTTMFQACHDQLYLHFRFSVMCTNTLIYKKENNKMEVVNSERIELFFRRKDKMNPYYCLEIDPLGRVLDYKASYYRKFNYDWQWPDALKVEAAIEEDKYVVCGRISKASLKNLNLLQNNEIQAGLFRGHCIKLKEENATFNWISWVDPATEKPDFHVPTAFGMLKLNPE